MDVSKSIVPLRTILQNFLNLVENCEGRRNEGDLYDKEFQDLKQFSENLKSDPFYQCKEGEKTVNRKKNRYKDILPFDYSRVPLTDYGDIPGSDYVNANFIKGASGSSAYIACQGPLPHTLNDFWRMVVECEVQVIVMACMEQESGKHKCENYWVEEDGVEREFGQVTVWLKKCRNVCSDFLVRTMRIRYSNSKGEIEERNVCQFHYSAWPDHGVPTKVRPLLDMVRLIRDCQTSETLPVLVHCSAGCGRTGTICAIDYVWGLLRLGKLTEEFSLFNLVREMRRQRIAMVQTKDQYILVHRAVKELFQEQLKIIDAHHYANVDQNGLPLELRQELEEPMYATIVTHLEVHPNPQSPSPSPPKSNNEETRLPKGESIIKLSNGSDVENANNNLPKGKRDYSTPEPLPPRCKKDEDFIETYNPGGEDTVDSCHFAVNEVSAPTSSSQGVSLLRKPSIVKLKALFEKSVKHDKERPKKSNVTPTGLSRAKSDVSASSRFYSITSSLTGSSRRGTPSSLSPKENPKTKSEMAKSKPPIQTKPILPIKRSKSLKIHPENSPPKPILNKEGTTNPVKVCVKHSEIPKLRSVLKQFSATEENYEPKDYESLSSRRESLEPLIQPSISRSDSTDSSSTLSRKPSLTSKTTITPKDIRTYERENWTKVSRESDSESGISSLSALKLKKYDTVTPKSALLVGSVTNNHNGSLTRSQSHIWQPQKEETRLTGRIFSNENISKSDAEKRNQIDLLKLEHNLSKEKKSEGINSALSVFGNPIPSKRIPKVTTTPLYTNYPFDTGLSSTTQSNSILNNSKPSGLYTSDSSNSLPSTPTHSIDRLYPKLMKNPNSQNPPPKSILKGSLSSTPSGSDERLDMRPQPLTYNNNTSVVTISNKLVNNDRLLLGVRERRNSFRQAVWKEAQNDGHQYHNAELQPNNTTTNNTNTLPTNSTEGISLLSSHRTTKDYEPIWPSELGASYRNNQQPNGNVNNSSNPPFKARIDDFKSLLDELKTPMLGNIKQPPLEQKDRKSPNLKYHRSLKAPSRSEYEQLHSCGGAGGYSSLSCFTFKKPSSLESITNQLEFEAKKSSYPFFAEDSSGASGFHSGRYSNDYVTLQHCREDNGGLRVHQQGVDEVDLPGSRQPQQHQIHNYHNGDTTPIPPPRTKRANLNDSTGIAPVNGNVNSNAVSHSGDVPDGSHKKINRNTSNGIPPTSPLATTRTKALGIFQDMKSKLANWAEPIGKERNQSSSVKRGSGQSNGSSSSGGIEITAHGFHSEKNGNSSKPNKSTSCSSSSSRLPPKHQYL